MGMWLVTRPLQPVLPTVSTLALALRAGLDSRRGNVYGVCMFKQIVLAMVLCSTAFAQGKAKPAPKAEQAPVTHIDASTPDAPSSEFPDVVKKGKL
jgi:hypothetical protein